MSSVDGDEYGVVDDEDMLLAATQADQTWTNHKRYEPETIPYPPCKRRRLIGSEDDIEGSLVASVTDSANESFVGGEHGESGTKKQRHDEQTDDQYSTFGEASTPPRAEILEEEVDKAHISKGEAQNSARRLPRGMYACTPKTIHNARPTTGSSEINQGQTTKMARELADLPSDAFSSPFAVDNTTKTPLELSSEQQSSQRWYPQTLHPQRLAGPQNNLRQTTLFGGRAPEERSPPQTQSVRRHNWPLANRDEAPTHHKLDRDALQTWVYPTNLGSIRDYQFNIVGRGLFHNLLVALPTGLGKTFIAATIMLNWFRWTTDAQIVFVAPTRPLVSQQVEACFNIAGIPRSATTMLTGGTAPALRSEEWKTKRVFFMTPQTIVNDLKHGGCDPKRIVLVVVDEAHRATGAYAYVEVVKFLRRFNPSFRVLALTATPGASVESVQEVIDGLGISRVEIRTEESIDISRYVHPRKIDTVLFEYSEEMVMVMDLFAKALQPVLNKLSSMNAYWSRDPMTLTPYGCTQARQKWNASDAGRKANDGAKKMVNGIFTILASLSHSIELLKFHGIGPFFHKVVDFRQEASGSKYKKQIIESDHFMTMMTRVQAWVNSSEFVGHPKLEYLRSVVMNHFLDAGEGRGVAVGVSPAATRVMVFAHYRDSAEEIVRVLKRNEPMIRPHVFVGQANSKGSDGMDQKKQLEIIRKFKDGIYNTIVATSIGEEGLDIGEVDLIVCYDASASPIRMLQRMGRTGRKRAGNIVVTLMKGKEESSFVQAKDNYEKMQRMIAIGTRFTFHEDLAPRIVPRDIQPVADRRIIDIPLENTQPDLPEPKKRARLPKRPPKKFHMPDGVRTGFTKASRLGNSGNDDGSDDGSPHDSPQSIRMPTPTPEPIPSLESVLLTASEERELERTYLDVGGDTPQIVEPPRLDAFPDHQRRPGFSKYVKHGKVTKRVVAMLRTIHVMTVESCHKLESNLQAEDRKAGQDQAEKRTAFLKGDRQSLRPPHDSHDSASESEPSLSTRPLTRPTAKALARPELVRSDREGDNEDEMADFIDDDETETASRALSSASSPPPLKSPDKLFYDPSQRKSDNSDSNEELPELDILVKSNGFTNAPALLGESAVDELPRPNQRKGKRNVVDSDSDE